MRITLIASIIALFVACGSEAPTAPTGPTTSVAPPPAAPAPLPSGSYEAVFTADAVCTDLPEAARIRIYSASVGSSSIGGSIALGGAVFGSFPPPYPTMSVLYVRLAGDFAYIYASDPPVLEHMTPDANLLIEGTAEGTVRADTSQLSFSGAFSYCSAVKPVEGSFMGCLVDRITCWSQNHRLTLTRK